MPYTEEFKKILNNFRSKYNDNARAETFAFKKAIKEKIPTWRERAKRIKYNKNDTKEIYRI